MDGIPVLPLKLTTSQETPNRRNRAETSGASDQAILTGKELQ